MCGLVQPDGFVFSEYNESVVRITACNNLPDLLVTLHALMCAPESCVRATCIPAGSFVLSNVLSEFVHVLRFCALCSVGPLTVESPLQLSF